MIKHSRLSFTILVGLAINTSQIALAEDATNTLPDAKPGECYAKVVLPATYKTETQNVISKEASFDIKVIPAKYEWVKEKVLVKEASQKITSINAVYGQVSEKIEISPTRKYWVTSLAVGAPPASSSLLNAATNSGINLRAVAVNTCYIESFIPATFKAETEKVLISEATESVAIIPAKYGMVDERVLVKAASSKVVEIPAIYETIKEKILVEPAKTVWKKGKGLAQRVDNTTGEIMCLIEVPAKYKTITKRIIKTKAYTKTIDIAAEYKTVAVRKLLSAAEEKRTSIPAKYTTVKKSVRLSDDVFSWHRINEKTNAKRTGNRICLTEKSAKFKTITKRVVKVPANTKTVAIPAEYKFLKVRKMISAAKESRIEIPAKYQTVAKRVKVGEERLEWKRVLCQTNMTKDVITNIQQALTNKGFNPGPIDGQIGSATMRAVDKYQQKNNLERGGLTLDTIKKLGIS